MEAPTTHRPRPRIVAGGTPVAPSHTSPPLVVVANQGQRKRSRSPSSSSSIDEDEHPPRRRRAEAPRHDRRKRARSPSPSLSSSSHSDEAPARRRRVHRSDDGDGDAILSRLDAVSLGLKAGDTEVFVEEVNAPEIVDGKRKSRPVPSEDGFLRDEAGNLYDKQRELSPYNAPFWDEFHRRLDAMGANEDYQFIRLVSGAISRRVEQMLDMDSLMHQQRADERFRTERTNAQQLRKDARKRALAEIEQLEKLRNDIIMQRAFVLRTVVSPAQTLFDVYKFDRLLGADRNEYPLMPWVVQNVIEHIAGGGRFKGRTFKWPLLIEDAVRMPDTMKVFKDDRANPIVVYNYTPRVDVATLTILERAQQCMTNRHVVAPEMWPMPADEPDRVRIQRRLDTDGRRVLATVPYDPAYHQLLSTGLGTIVAYALLELFPVVVDGESDAPLFEIPTDDAAAIEAFRRTLPPYFDKYNAEELYYRWWHSPRITLGSALKLLYYNLHVMPYLHSPAYADVLDGQTIKINEELQTGDDVYAFARNTALDETVLDGIKWSGTSLTAIAALRELFPVGRLTMPEIERLENPFEFENTFYRVFERYLTDGNRRVRLPNPRDAAAAAAADDDDEDTLIVLPFAARRIADIETPAGAMRAAALSHVYAAKVTAADVLDFFPVIKGVVTRQRVSPADALARLQDIAPAVTVLPLYLATIQACFKKARHFSDGVNDFGKLIAARIDFLGRANDELAESDATPSLHDIAEASYVPTAAFRAQPFMTGRLPLSPTFQYLLTTSFDFVRNSVPHGREVTLEDLTAPNILRAPFVEVIAAMEARLQVRFPGQYKKDREYDAAPAILMAAKFNMARAIAEWRRDGGGRRAAAARSVPGVATVMIF